MTGAPVVMDMRCLALIVSAVLLQAGCAFGPDARLLVLLPTLPDPWRAAFPRIDCLLRYVDDSGEIHWEHLEGWESGHAITCAKDANSPVLAYPLLPLDQDPQQPGVLRPAGGVYPVSLREDGSGPAIELTWQDGAVAHVTEELGRGGLDASLFNVARLAEELRKRSDPWDLDLDAMVEEIASGDFDLYDIDALPLRDIHVASGPGTWVMESPFRSAVESEAGGVLSLGQVSRGLHTLLSLDGRIVKVDVDGNGVISLPAPPAAGGGDRDQELLPPLP